MEPAVVMTMVSPEGAEPGGNLIVITPFRGRDLNPSHYTHWQTAEIAAGSRHMMQHLIQGSLSER